MMSSGHFLQYLVLLIKGAGVTLELSVISIAIGTALGVAIGVARAQRHWSLSVPALLIIEAIRSTPFLVLLFFVYYGLPVVLGVDIPPYPSAVLALSLYTAGYMADVVRAGIESVPVSQRQAATALGLSRAQVFFLIVLPQAIPVMVPPAVGVCISSLKESALASAIGFVELLGTGLAIRESLAGTDASDVLLWVAAMYFILCYSLSILGGRLERHWGGQGVSGGRGEIAAGQGQQPAVSAVRP